MAERRTSASCSPGLPAGSTPTGRRSRASTSAPRRPRPAEACTACAAMPPRVLRSGTSLLAAEVTYQPIARQLGDALDRSGLFEQVAGARDDLERLVDRELLERLPV